MSSALVSPPSFAVRRAPVAVIALLGLALLTLGIRVLTGVGADALGDVLGGRLSGALAPLTSALAAAEPDAPLAEAAPASDALWLTATTGSEKGAHGAKRARQPARVHAIRISSAQVLALASQRVMPNAVPVKASAEHPAGLALRSVSGLGVGLQDGDVLTEAAGQKASSVAAVIGLVLAARARHSREISGRFFRAGVAYELTVEQPYPEEPVPG